MGIYVPSTKQEQQEMLHEMGSNDFEGMLSHIPGEVMLKGGVQIPSGPNEQAVVSKMEEMARKNVVFRHIFRGAGAYNHYILTIVSSVISKEEFVTAYTPCQTGVGQGILQSIFEYQTTICELIGMDASNVSVYNSAAATEGAMAACKGKKRSTVYVSATAGPGTIGVIKTYCFGSNTKVVIAPEKDEVTDTQALEDVIKADPQATCFYVQRSDYCGNLEGGESLGHIAHEAGTKYIMSCNSMALAVMRMPTEYDADIAVGDEQPLGMPLAFGGPYLGLVAATATMIRKLSGRIVGETADSRSERTFALTLQAREQHARREKAGSNICSNQMQYALIISVHMAAMRTDGTEKATIQCMLKVHYLRDVLKLTELGPGYNHGFFHKFVTVSPEGVCSGSAHILGTLEKRGILNGLPLSDREVFQCATEMSTKEKMDEVASVVRNASEYGHEEICGS